METPKKHKPSKKHRRLKRLQDRQAVQANGVCPKCINSFVNRSVRTFRDGKMHVELRCATCNRFIKWGD